MLVKLTVNQSRLRSWLSILEWHKLMTEFGIYNVTFFSQFFHFDAIVCLAVLQCTRTFSSWRFFFFQNVGLGWVEICTAAKCVVVCCSGAVTRSVSKTTGSFYLPHARGQINNPYLRRAVPHSLGARGSQLLMLLWSKHWREKWKKKKKRSKKKQSERNLCQAFN